MEVFIIGLHVFLCLFLILVVLLQPGKGADFGAAMGGSSQEAFGAAGSVSILTKLTAVVAAMFMATSLGLAWYSNTDGSGSELSPEALEEAAGGAASTEEAAPSGDAAPEADAAAPETNTAAESDTAAPEADTATEGEPAPESDKPAEADAAPEAEAEAPASETSSEGEAAPAGEAAAE